MIKEPIKIYTDGACSGNGKDINFGGLGIVVVKNGEVVFEFKKGYNNTTNNIMELSAVYYAIALAKKIIKQDKLTIVEVYSDSEYVVNSINRWMDNWEKRGWKTSGNKPVKNLELMRNIYYLMQFERQIKVFKIAGHSGNTYNEMADSLAVSAREQKEKEYLLERSQDGK